MNHSILRHISTKMNIFWKITWALAVFAYTEVNTFHLTPVEIVNGTNAKEGEFPYMVQIQDTRKDFFCGGSIISDRWILTAGHCLPFNIIDAVIFGTNELYDKRDGPKNNTIKVRRFFRHPKFTAIETKIGFMPIYDVGLLELIEPIVFNDKVQPVKLAEANEAVPFHVEGILAGWGQNQTEGPSEPYLQKIQLPLLTDDECRKRIDDYIGADIFQPFHNLCSDDHWNGECRGDSGSPYVINGTQYGIVSWSIKPCGSSPGTYSRLVNPEYRQFIKNVTGI